MVLVLIVHLQVDILVPVHHVLVRLLVIIVPVVREEAQAILHQNRQQEIAVIAEGVALAQAHVHLTVVLLAEVFLQVAVVAHLVQAEAILEVEAVPVVEVHVHQEVEDSFSIGKM
jgi:hypothetical protein